MLLFFACYYKNVRDSLRNGPSLFFVLGVEALVGWLLDHPDVQITDLSDADTISDEYSDEEIAEEVEEAEAACPMVSISLLKPKWCCKFLCFFPVVNLEYKDIVLSLALQTVARTTFFNCF